MENYQPQTSGGINAFFQNVRLQYLFLALTALLFYGNTFWNEYAVDDDIVIAGNKYTVKGLKGLPKIFLTDSFEGYFNEKVDLLPGGRYRPLSIATFAVEYQFWKANPAASHVVNVGLYIFSLVVLLALLRRFIFPNNPIAAFLAVFLFAIHPVHTEAVTNLKGRDEVLSLLCLAGSLYYLLHFAEKEKLTPDKPEWGTLGASLFCYYLALLAKENGLVFIALVPLTLYYFTGLTAKRTLVLTGLFAACVAVYIVQRIAIIGLHLENSPDVLNNAYLFASPVERSATMIYLLGYYIRLTFFPHPLSWDYSYKAFDYQDFSSPWFWVAFVGQAALFLWAVWAARRKNIVAYGVLFYFISISIVSGIINIGGAFIGDRFTYQASLGFAIAVAALLTYVRSTQIIAALLAPITLAAGYKTITRNAEWKNNETLYPVDVLAVPNSAKTNHGAGWAYKNISQKTEDPILQKKYLKQSEQYLKKSLSITPEATETLYEMALVQHLQNRYAEAEKYYLKVLKLFPDYPECKPNLAQLYSTQSNNIYARYKNSQPPLDSLRYFLSKQLEFAPDNPSVWANLGIVTALDGDHRKAITCFQRALVLAPTNAENWYNQAQCYLRLNDKTEAINNYKRCLKLNPQHARARAMLTELEK